jgi:preprotein translocase subunit SecG
MTNVLLVVHIFVTIALIGVVLIQRSEGGGLGIGSSQGMGSFMTGRGTANLLTRTTSILAALFFGLSLALALLNRGTGGVGRSILDVPAAQTTAPAPAAKLPPAPPVPVGPPAAGTPAPAGTAVPAPAPSTPPPAAPAKPGAQPGAPSVPVN